MPTGTESEQMLGDELEHAGTGFWSSQKRKPPSGIYRDFLFGVVHMH